MQIQQLTTILCLCFSQALAASVEAFKPKIQSLVVDLTEHRVIPGERARGTRYDHALRLDMDDALRLDMDEPVADPNYTPAFYRDYIQGMNPLTYVDKESTNSFLDARAAYEATLRGDFTGNFRVQRRRLRICQNAMYSRLCDIVKKGDDETVARVLKTYHEEVKFLINKHSSEVPQVQKLERAPPKPQLPFVYRTQELADKELLKTNHPGTDIPKARLIHGARQKAYEDFLLNKLQKQGQQVHGSPSNIRRKILLET
ncbi:hypothetical protein MJO28_000544 [Puccinia striiformis f. sp. tritici]|uniref:Uncharacterized protein n=1 Tax=Puccinia striiformis f. sp. tritici TaxID=168172 RepID=A0ACC0EY78_9BASI|nr:hypothetical protein Pst134EA_000692 [Puccinia striiformis f. sp. tritici]KAI9600218.1 hypothetical protein KEM48_000825 [Puccinia striiformis f. sp. tritici PST-130]KAH9473611.1 hypothetical protein Pst134EA_000692 [Puccinia striiformis f. sp. tritici]KAI7962450.1 hypothetical protein MJO28_000544 [Puccinia striiformis f. sp. tritici]KAI7967403.1 hypothetical protein MJO29_000680 [Puccinia striiformis f. sp. tritici]KAI9601093.1 hypothetical protein H4Q26_000892 [Puccinia striiformis f. sp